MKLLPLLSGSADKLKAGYYIAKQAYLTDLPRTGRRLEPSLHRWARAYARRCLVEGDLREYEKAKEEYFVPLGKNDKRYGLEKDEEEIFLSAMRGLLKKGRFSLAADIASLEKKWRILFLRLLLEQGRFLEFCCLVGKQGKYSKGEAKAAKAIVYFELMEKGDREGRLRLIRSGLYDLEDVGTAIYGKRLRALVASILCKKSTGEAGGENNSYK
ncbi:MAG: hypothetical protein N3E51_04370 [Candidatus Micrarchaeota archaeon]|nr:hypothetical protein [Candidatus Micrarchaeota archaeon]